MPKFQISVAEWVPHVGKWMTSPSIIVEATHAQAALEMITAIDDETKAFPPGLKRDRRASARERILNNDA